MNGRLEELAEQAGLDAKWAEVICRLIRARGEK